MVRRLALFRAVVVEEIGQVTFHAHRLHGNELNVVGVAAIGDFHLRRLIYRRRGHGFSATDFGQCHREFVASGLIVIFVLRLVRGLTALLGRLSFPARFLFAIAFIRAGKIKSQISVLFFLLTIYIDPYVNLLPFDFSFRRKGPSVAAVVVRLFLNAGFIIIEKVFEIALFVVGFKVLELKGVGVILAVDIDRRRRSQNIPFHKGRSVFFRQLHGNLMRGLFIRLRLLFAFIGRAFRRPSNF